MKTRIPRTALLVAIPVIVFGVALALLHTLHMPYAEWLRVEVPHYATIGSTFDVRVSLGSVPKPSFLAVDLYLLDHRHWAIGDPVHVPAPLAKSGGAYSFQFEVRDAENLAYLQLVICLSPTGEWRTRTHAAHTDAIPVRAHPGPGIPALEIIHAYVISETANPDVPFQPGAGSPEPTPVYSSATFRTFLAGLLAVGAMACLVRSLRPRVVGRQGADQGPRQERLFLRGAAVLFLLGFFWEVLRLEDRLSDWGRDVVSLLGLYYYRQSYQEAGLALLAAAFAVVLILCVRAVVRRRTRLYPVLAGLALAGYVGLSLAAAASFHYLDTWERMSLVGASVVDLARAACVAAALALVCAAPLPRGK